MESTKASEQEVRFSEVSFLDLRGLDEAESHKLYQILGVPFPDQEQQGVLGNSGQTQAPEPLGHIGTDSPIQFMTESTLPPEAFVGSNELGQHITAPNGGQTMVHVPTPVPLMPGDITPDLAQFYQTQPPPNMRVPGTNVNAAAFVPGMTYPVLAPTERVQMQPVNFPFAPVTHHVPMPPMGAPVKPQQMQGVPVAPNTCVASVLTGSAVPILTSSKNVTAPNISNGNIASVPATVKPAFSQNDAPAGKDVSQVLSAKGPTKPSVNAQGPTKPSVNAQLPAKESNQSTSMIVLPTPLPDKNMQQGDSAVKPTRVSNSVSVSVNLAVTSAVGGHSTAPPPEKIQQPTPPPTKDSKNYSAPKGPTMPPASTQAANAPSGTALSDSTVNASPSLKVQPAVRTSSVTQGGVTSPQNVARVPPPTHSERSADPPPPPPPAGFPSLASTATPRKGAGFLNGVSSSSAEGLSSSAKTAAAPTPSAEQAPPAAGADATSTSAAEKAKPEEPKPAFSFAAAAAAPPTKMSYAFCVKGNNPQGPAPVVIYKPETEKTPTTSPSAEESKAQEKLVVSVEKDSMSLKLGGFLSTYAVNHVGVPLIPRGMTNTSNWCFMNSTLQALMSAPQVYHLLKNMGILMDEHCRKESSTPICDSLVTFINEFSKAGRQGNSKRGRNTEVTIGQSFDPSYIRKLLVSHNSFSKTYKNGRQEDAHEFFQALVNGSHEEQALLMKHATGKGKAEANGYPEANGCDAENAEEDGSDGDGWMKVDSKGKATEVNLNVRHEEEKTPMKQIFGGVSVRSIFQQGKGERATEEHWNDFPLDSQCGSVLEALVNITKKEIIQVDSGELTHQTKIEVLPPVLVLHYKTFQYDLQTGVSEKIIKDFKFDVDLTIPKELLTTNARSKILPAQRNYKLCAVVFHHGKKATGGHYTSVTFDIASQSWLHKDDSNVTVIPESKLLQYYTNNITNQMPYMLFYRQRHLYSHNGASDSH
ncbi:ubiquitin carboxyl-terminal hydrolase 10-like isoform X2 [Littorina saxatilis]|uniref:ubiquitin carboxyl-terminal hydrolase 10-like isoform X2 n=1 Tax=Littorina saxatilis TaxID=31220 RepID=UPI0038B48744